MPEQNFFEYVAVNYQPSEIVAIENLCKAWEAALEHIDHDGPCSTISILAVLVAVDECVLLGLQSEAIVITNAAQTAREQHRAIQGDYSTCPN